MKGFYLSVNNGLIDPKHCEQMGIAIWLFMWFLDRMTSVSEEGIGLVLGGKPIKYTDVEKDLGLPERNYNRWISILKKYGYINTTRTPYGLIISVNKAQKIYSQRPAKNGGTEKDTPKMAEPDTPKMAGIPDKNGGSNIRKRQDSRQDNTPKPPNGELSVFLKEFNEGFGGDYRETKGRAEKLKLRLKTYSLEQVLAALKNLSLSKFHRGENERGWKADPDFLLRSDEQIDKWLNTTPMNGKQAGSPSATMIHRGNASGKSV